MKRKGKENAKRFLSVLLVVVMTLFLTPGSALEIAVYAEETASPEAEEETLPSAAEGEMTASMVIEETTVSATAEETIAPAVEEETTAFAAEEETTAPEAMEETTASVAEEETTAPAAMEETTEETTTPAAEVLETTVGSEETQSPVLHVQALIDALPDAGTITAESVPDVEDQLAAIDKARAALTDAELDGLDTARYEAAVSALLALEDLAGADVPQLLANTGAFTVTGGTYGTDYTYGNGVLTVLDGANITVSMANGAASTTDHIFVADDASASITLNGVNIDCSATEKAAAFQIADGSQGNVTVTLTGNNTLKSGWYCAGLHKNNWYHTASGTLTITGDGSLTAIGGKFGAGIGGGSEEEWRGNTKNITIAGGTVTAIGGDSSAGIGSGWYADAYNITITGGVVNARGAYRSAGIGSGTAGGVDKITITGGIVIASGGDGGAGIGGGGVLSGNKNPSSIKNTNIGIKGGTITANGGKSSDGIGRGLYYNSQEVRVSITGGSIRATSSGPYSKPIYTLRWEWGWYLKEITLVGAGDNVPVDGFGKDVYTQNGGKLYFYHLTDYPESITVNGIRYIPASSVPGSGFGGGAYIPELTVELNGYDTEKVYDGKAIANPTDAQLSLPASSLTLQWYQGDTLLSTLPVNVGDYKLKISETGGFGCRTFDISIIARPLAISANSQTFICQRGEIKTGLDQVTCDALADGDTLTGITVSTAHTNAGTYNDGINVSDAVIMRDGMDVTANYDITYKAGVLIIEPTEWPSALPINYGQKLVRSYLYFVNEDGTFSFAIYRGFRWEDDSYSPSEAGTCYCKVVYTPEDPNCGKVSKWIPVTVNRAPTWIRNVTLKEKTYDGTADASVSNVFFTYEDNYHRDLAANLKQDIDYTVTAVYDDANAGTNKTATVTVTLLETYFTSRFTLVDNTFTCTGTILPKPITPTVEVSETLFEWNGNAKEPVVTVTYTENGQAITIPEEEYEVTYSDNTNAGEAVVTVSGVRNYSFTAAAKFTITPASIEDAEVTVDGSCIYTGTGHTPDLTVTLGGKTLVKDTDYTVSYDGNVNAGTAAVTVTGIGNYTGEATGSFTIGKAVITDVSAAVDSVEEPKAQGAVQGVVTGGSGYSASVTWEPADSTYNFNTAYTATLTLTPDGNHLFGELSPEGWTAAVGGNGIVTLTKTFPATHKERIVSLASINDVTLTTHTDKERVIDDELPVTVNAATETKKTVPLTLSWNCETFDTSPNAENTFTWTVTDVGSYDAGGVTLTGTIKVTNPDALPVSISGTDKEITYNGTAIDVSKLFTIDKNAGAATYRVTNITREGTLAGSILTVTKAGTFTVTVNTEPKGIYAAGEASVTLTVNPKTLTPYLEGTTEKTYDGTTNASDGLYIKLGGVEKDDDVTASADYSYDSCDAGKRTITADSITLDGEKAGCYILSAATAAAEGSIQQAVLTITATDQTITYGDSIIQGTAQVEAIGLQGSDALDSITLIAIGDQAAEENSVEPSDAVIKNGGVDVTANYHLNYQPGKLTIEPAMIGEIQVNGYTGIYDGKAHGITVTGYPSGVTVQYGTEDGTYDLTENPTYTDAGSYTVYYQLTSPNYKTVTGSAVVTIEKKEVTVSITADGGVYNGEPFEASAEPEGAVEDETVIVTLTYTGQGETIGSTVAPVDVGTYTVTAAIPDSNYKLAGLDSKDFTITPAGIEDAEVMVDGSYIYTGTAHTPDPTVMLGGKTLLKDTDYTVSYDGNVNAGTATVTVTGIGNYTGEVTGSFTIAPKSITVTVTPNGGVYGGEITGATAVLNDVVTGDTAPEVTLTYTGTANDGTEVGSTETPQKAGTYTVTASIPEGNYVLTGQTAAQFQVVGKPIRVTAGSVEVTYGDPAPELTYTVATEDLVGEDTLTGITVMRQEGSNVGEYTVTPAQEEGANPNYEIELVSGTLTIQPKDIGEAEIVLGASLTANGQEQTQEVKRVTVKNSEGESMEATYSITGNTAVEAGEYTMTITGTGNFTGTKEQSFVIAPKADVPETTVQSSEGTDQTAQRGESVNQILGIEDYSVLWGIFIMVAGIVLFLMTAAYAVRRKK